MEFAEVVKKLMSDRGINQAQLAKRANMSEAQISYICNGKTKDPRLSTLISVAHGLDCSLDDLYVK